MKTLVPVSKFFPIAQNIMHLKFTQAQIPETRGKDFFKHISGSKNHLVLMYLPK